MLDWSPVYPWPVFGRNLMKSPYVWQRLSIKVEALRVFSGGGGRKGCNPRLGVVESAGAWKHGLLCLFFKDEFCPLPNCKV